MRYIAMFGKGAFLTDDYSPEEIRQKLHIKHILKDIELAGIKNKVFVYDENNKFICVLNQKIVA